MGEFFSLLLAKISGLAGWFGELFKAVFSAYWDLYRDVVCWPVEQGLDAAISMVQGVDVSAIQQWASVWGTIPSNVLEVFSALGLGTAFGIITTAIGIRFVLQLIPFVRLGS